MRVVVDTSIVFRALLSRNSPIWRHLFQPEKTISFFAPRFLVMEIKEHWDRILKKTKMEADDLVVARDEIFEHLTFIDIEEISTADRARAYELCRDVDAKDTPFVALSMHLQALFWTNDVELRKGISPNGFTFFFEPHVTTQTMVDYLEAVGSITGQGFVQNSRVDPEGDAVVTFFHDFDEYRKAHPTSRITADQFTRYFATGDRILKSLLLDSVRILRNLPTLRSIDILLPFEGDIWSVKLSRSEAEEYFGIDLLELAYDPAKWVQFTSDVGYDRNRRKDFFRRFGRQEKA